MRTAAVRVRPSTLGAMLSTLPTKLVGERGHVDLHGLTRGELAELELFGGDHQLDRGGDQGDDRGGRADQRARSDQAVLDASVDGRHDGRFPDRQLRLRDLRVGLVDRGLGGLVILVGVWVLGLVEDCLRLGHRLCLLLQVEGGVRLAGLLQLLGCLGDLARWARMSSAVLGVRASASCWVAWSTAACACGDPRRMRPSVDLVEPRLVGLEAFAGGL